MKVTINGEPREIPEGWNVRNLLAHLGLDARIVAVERNLEILPRGQWGQTEVAAGDRYEIVHMVGGG